jgi:hypothetical protein
MIGQPKHTGKSVFSLMAERYSQDLEKQARKETQIQALLEEIRAEVLIDPSPFKEPATNPSSIRHFKKRIAVSRKYKG